MEFSGEGTQRLLPSGTFLLTKYMRLLGYLGYYQVCDSVGPSLPQYESYEDDFIFKGTSTQSGVHLERFHLVKL